MKSANHTFQSHVLTPSFIQKSLLISLGYLIASNIINQFAIYSNIFSQNYSLLLKLKIASVMFWNSQTMFGSLNAIVLLVIALLVGINIMLVVRKIAIVRTQRNVQWTFGAGIFSLASSSCPGCGFSLLSITGLTSAIPGLPFEGLNFSLVTFGILTITTLYNLRSLGIQSCALPKRT